MKCMNKSKANKKATITYVFNDNLYVCTFNFVMPPTKLWVGIKICTSPYIRPSVHPEILCVQLLLHTLIDFIHTHTQWPTWPGDDRKDEIWDAASFTWVIGLGIIFYSIAYRGEILFAQLLLHPFMDFVHTYTQWPTWYEDAQCFIRRLHSINQALSIKSH